MARIFWSTEHGIEEHKLGVQNTIGRLAGNDIHLISQRVSGHHAQVVFRDGVWTLKDLTSTNGTFVNGQRCDCHILQEGDVIRIGDVDLTFQTSSSQDRLSSIPGKSQGAVPPSVCPGDNSGFVISADIGEILKGDVVSTTIRRVSADFSASRTEETGLSSEAIARRLAVCYEIARTTAGTLKFSEMLDRVVAAVFDIFGKAGRCLILLVDPKTQEMTVGSAKRRQLKDADDFSISRTVLGEAMEKRQAVLCGDAMADNVYSKAQSVMALTIRSIMIAPLVFKDEALGAIYVDTRSAADQFNQADLELLSVAASQVAAWVYNARLHETLVASERLAAVGQTVAGLTHCIKNILQGIQGGSFMLEKALREGAIDRVATSWEMVKKNNAFIEDLVFDLLNYSKPRSPEYELVDFNAVCRETCEFVISHARGKGVTLEFSSQEREMAVEIDPNGIKRCLLNLITNAVDACKDRSGAVTVETWGPGQDGLVHVRIKDTGCGMSKETRAKLFTVFFSTKGSKGTGLGLPVTKKIVEEHGGIIEVQSGEREGTVFTIALPAKRTKKNE